MKPILFHLFSYPIPSHGIFYLLGSTAALIWGYYEGRRCGLDPNKILDIGFWIAIVMIVGSRLTFVAIYPELFTEDPLRVFRIWEGGMVLYGGVAGSIIASLVVIKVLNMPVGKAADVVTQSGVLGLAIGRTGCLFAGCCYGRPTEAPWCISYTDHAALAYRLVGDKCLHPTPIYSALWLFFVFALLVWLSRRKSFPGRETWCFFLVYPVGRFIIEFYRGDPRGFFLEPYLSRLFAPFLEHQTYSLMPAGGFYHAPYLSTSQLISVPVFILAAAGYFISARRAKQ